MRFNYHKLINRTLIVLIIALISAHSSYQQHIFQETCSYTFVLDATNHTEITASSETATFGSQIQLIESKHYNVYINLCAPLGSNPSATLSASSAAVTLPAACDKRSYACIVRKRQNGAYRVQIANAAMRFRPRMENGTHNLILTADTPARCSGDDAEAYDFKIVISKTVNENKIEFSDECSLHIQIPHPDVIVRSDCGATAGGFFLDMRNVRDAGEQIINLNNNGSRSRIVLSACAAAPSCRSDVTSICDVSSSGNIFSVAESQHFVYDERSNEMIIRGRNPHAKKIKSEVKLNCNWTATFDNPKKLPAKYKYSIETRYGCVKMPPKCRFEDIKSFVYDLSTLNRPTGWKVANTSTNLLMLNVCGQLKIENVKKECSDKFSQICYQNTSTPNNFLSYGALTKGFNVDTSDDTVKLQLTHGSICPHNNSYFLTSTLSFVCDAREHGPLLKSLVNCTMSIEWRTPAACPLHINPSTNLGAVSVKARIARFHRLACTVIDESEGKRFDLSSLMVNTSMVIDSPTHQRKYYINICRPVNVTDSTYLCGETGACIEELGEINIKYRFMRVGSVANPRYENGALFMKYNGGYCRESSSGLREVIILFKCARTQGHLALSKETSCRTEFEWKTPLACDTNVGNVKNKRQSSRDCIVNTTTSTKDKHLHIDFSKFTQRKVTLIHDATNYTFDACADTVQLTSDGGNTRVVMATRQLLHNQYTCANSLLYTLTNNDVIEDRSVKCQNLTSLKVEIVCDDIVGNAEHFDSASIDCGVATLVYKSNAACKLSFDCLQRDVATNAISSSNAATTKSKQSIQKIESNEENCKIANEDREFLIKSMGPIKIANGKDVYSINQFDSNDSCQHFVCKNNQMLASLSPCPSVNFDPTDGVVRLGLLGAACNATALTSESFYKVTIDLRCSTQNANYTFKMINECAYEFTIDSNQICALFKSKFISALPAAVLPSSSGQSIYAFVVGIVTLCVAIAVIMAGIWRYQRKSRCCTFNGGERLHLNAPYFKDGDD